VSPREFILYIYQCEYSSPRVLPCLPASSRFLYKALARRPRVQQGCVPLVGFRLLSLHGGSVRTHGLPPAYWPGGQQRSPKWPMSFCR
jgi:hypothetical protein